MSHRKVAWVRLLVFALATSGCRGEARDDRGPLPRPAAGLPAQDSVRQPFTEVAPGVFARTAFRTEPRPGLRVEVRDIEVAPGKTADGLAFPGAVIIEIRNGKGSGRVAGKSRDIAPGDIVAQSQGDPIVIDNSGTVPLSVRVYVIGAR